MRIQVVRADSRDSIKSPAVENVHASISDIFLPLSTAPEVVEIEAVPKETPLSVAVLAERMKLSTGSGDVITSSKHGLLPNIRRRLIEMKKESITLFKPKPKRRASASSCTSSRRSSLSSVSSGSDMLDLSEVPEHAVPKLNEPHQLKEALDCIVNPGHHLTAEESARQIAVRSAGHHASLDINEGDYLQQAIDQALVHEHAVPQYQGRHELKEAFESLRAHPRHPLSVSEKAREFVVLTAGHHRPSDGLILLTA